MPRLRLIYAGLWTNALLGVLAFLVLAAAILSRPAKDLMEFDQPFYVTIAYDLDRHGIFSNGIFVDVDSTAAAPRPGMFFGPVYPLLVLAAMKIDPRFAEAVRCSVEADRGHRDKESCEPYAAPVRIIHAFLLALGVVAVAGAAQLMFVSRAVFWLSGLLATAALAAEAEIFSFVMTEAVTFALYGLFSLCMIAAWRTARPAYFVLGGCALGLLCLTRLSFLIMLPLVIILTVLHGFRRSAPPMRSTAAGIAGMVLVFAAILAGWTVRNAVSVGKFGLTEEYGSAALIERFAYDDMSAREFFLAFPFCTPGLGELAFDTVYGTDSMHRFVYHTPGSFFHVGRDRRDQLVSQYGRLDPLIGDIVRDEARAIWWRHLLVAVPLAWCGMWPGWVVSLPLVPLFAWTCLGAVRQRQPLFLLYTAPALTMLALHALMANQYTRYNLILIGPYAVGAASIIARMIARRRRPERKPRALEPAAIFTAD